VTTWTRSSAGLSPCFKFEREKEKKRCNKKRHTRPYVNPTTVKPLTLDLNRTYESFHRKACYDQIVGYKSRYQK
jgi:hypothetical protein